MSVQKVVAIVGIPVGLMLKNGGEGNMFGWDIFPNSALNKSIGITILASSITFLASKNLKTTALIGLGAGILSYIISSKDSTKPKPN